MIITSGQGITPKQLEENVGIQNIQKGSISDKLTYTITDNGNYHKIYTFDNYEVSLNGFKNPDKMIYLIQPYGYGENGIITGNVSYKYNPSISQGVASEVQINYRIRISNIELKKDKMVFYFDPYQGYKNGTFADFTANNAGIKFLYEIIEFK